MKLFLTFFLASALLLKCAESAVKGDVGQACLDDGSCTLSTTASCVSSACACNSGFTATTDDPPKCLKSNGQECEEAKAAECFSAYCGKKCGKKDGEVCEADVDCANENCEEKKCAAGAASLVFSVLLMAVTFVTSRIL